jgi:hypothetical protein
VLNVPKSFETVKLAFCTPAALSTKLTLLEVMLAGVLISSQGRQPPRALGLASAPHVPSAVPDRVPKARTPQSATAKKRLNGRAFRKIEVFT